jgi:hypothetical protein
VSPSPTYVTPGPSSRSSGSTVSNAARGPDTATDSRPARTTRGLPDTGAASSTQPRAAAARRISADAPADTVLASTRYAGTRSPRSRPPSPSVTSRRSASRLTIVNTTSRPPSSSAPRTSVAPRPTSPVARDRVRFQTCRSTPPASSRSAIGNPIRPVPIQPTR